MSVILIKNMILPKLSDDEVKQLNVPEHVHCRDGSRGGKLTGDN